MFGFSKNKARSTPKTKPSESSSSWLARIQAGLDKTRNAFAGGLGQLLSGKKQLDDDTLEALEERLLAADVGVDASRGIIDQLNAKARMQARFDAETLPLILQETLTEALAKIAKPLVIPADQKPFVVLVVGVNGVGKTTTIGKLSRRFQNAGKSVMLAAGDTFRAAAVEQLQRWGERNEVPVIAQHTGADSASVIFDAVQAATARGVDILLADTAGRLHNKDNLMAELGKIIRVIKKAQPEAPHEVLLVLDAGTGLNAISQVAAFNELVPITGLTLTKLDGTAKGGVLFALAEKFAIPVRFLGVGEQAQDLNRFDAEEFVSALLTKTEQ